MQTQSSSTITFQQPKPFTILITGDKGFVGTETKKLLTNCDVIGYDLLDGLDIRDKSQFYEFCLEHKPDRVLHLAAIARFSDADKDPKLTFETNQLGTKNVVEVCKELHIPLVYASTGSVYMPINQEPPITESFPAIGNSQYGCSKLIGEKFVQEHTPHIILRYAHIYGQEKRGHGLIGGFWDRIHRGLKPQLFGGTQSNDFCYIKDIAQANVLALLAPWDKWNQIYNIGTGEELTAQEAGEIVCEITGWKGGIDTVKGREVDPQRFVYDITKAKVMLGFNPKFSFLDGLRDMFQGGTNGT